MSKTYGTRLSEPDATLKRKRSIYPRILHLGLDYWNSMPFFIQLEHNNEAYAAAFINVTRFTAFSIYDS